ncbi:MAG: hypothetical protein ACYDDF_10030 [Thermoplasmatota archaeon]
MRAGADLALGGRTDQTNAEPAAPPHETAVNDARFHAIAIVDHNRVMLYPPPCRIVGVPGGAGESEGVGLAARIVNLGTMVRCLQSAEA